jgi:HSP20 family protein
MTNRDPHSWMWAEALDLLEQADRMHRQFCGLAGPGGAPARWQPPVDVFESASEVIVTVALPGVAPEGVAVRFDNGGLAIAAERRSPIRDRAISIRQLEIPYGHFERRIALPAGAYELVEQAAMHGCLQLRLRKVSR